MSARLFCRFGQLAGTECEFELEATVGSQAGNRLVLSEAADHQARIFFDEEAGCYLLEDLSGGGTVLDGLPVEGRMRLGRLHVVTFAAKHDFFFHCDPEERPKGLKETVDLGDLGLSEADLEEPPSTGTIRQTSPRIPSPPLFQPGQKPPQTESSQRTQAPKTVGGHEGGIPIPDFLKKKPASPKPSPQGEEPPVNFVLEIDLPEGIKSYPLAPGENFVGRSPSCSVFVEHHAFSRRHAALVVDSGTIKIRDLGSTNKTFVEGKPISRETEIAPGTPLAFAKIKARVREEES